jgi:predicted DCC family thiol-disulfide oxidoreductase YuxK
MPETPTTPEVTVYFDGSCPLCRREIALYRRQRGAQRLAWVDVSAGGPLGEGLACEAAMRRFHVREAQGRLLSGGAAFARLWRALPAWRVLGWAFAWPPMSWALEFAYRLFLSLRPRIQGWVRRRWPDAEASA